MEKRRHLLPSHPPSVPDSIPTKRKPTTRRTLSTAGAKSNSTYPTDDALEGYGPLTPPGTADDGPGEWEDSEDE